MSLGSAPRIRPLALPTPSLRIATSDAEDRQQAKARRRLMMAKIAASADSLPEARRVIEMMAGADGGGRGVFTFTLPSLKTLGRLKTRFLAGERDVLDYRDGERTGRPPVTLPLALAGMVDDFVTQHTAPSVRRLTRRMQEHAQSENLPAPSASTVARRLPGLRLERTAAKFGRRTAELEAMPHGTVPVEFTHDVWVLDEMRVPVWARIYSTEEQAWVAVSPDLVLIEDAASRVILAAHVCDPTRRREATGLEQEAGFDRADVVGALMSAAMPELAAPRSCAPFAGHLPKILRWDNATVHISARDGGPVVGGDTFAPLADVIEIPHLPTGRPINRGLVERLVGTLKSLCHDFPTHVDRVRPATRARVLPAAERVAGAAMGSRVPRRTVVPVEFLPTMPELQAYIAFAVEQYHRTPHEGLDGMTPADAYQAKKARATRSGRDLISVLPSRAVTVGATGITFRHLRRRHDFAAVTDAFRYRIDRTLTVHCDPLYRGLFTLEGGRYVFLPRAVDEARRTDPATFAREQREPARVASIAAAKAQTKAAAEAIAAKLLREIEADVAEGAAEHEAEADPSPASATPESSPSSDAESRIAADIAGNTTRRRPARPGSRGFGPRRTLDDDPANSPPDA